MTYRMTLALPCGTRHVVCSVAEAMLMITMGWQLVSMRGRCISNCVAG